jgi:hypothetical protein
MKKIKAITLTNLPYHPAVGSVYKLTFEDNTTALVYAETFYHQFSDFDSSNLQNLVGREINTEEGYFDY